MKNTLSENMNRYGTKNLSESEQTKLIIRSIMETIDQHGLYKVIKNKLAEQNPGIAKYSNVFVDGKKVINLDAVRAFIQS